MNKLFTLSIAIMFFFVLIISENSWATLQKQEKKAKYEKAVIKTSAVCNMCKTKIEHHLKSINGIEKAVVSLGNQQVKLKYDPQQITLDKVKQAISQLGYDADNIKANPEAYQKLPSCCKVARNKASGKTDH
jgi:mercuric ion binding protein